MRELNQLPLFFIIFCNDIFFHYKQNDWRFGKMRVEEAYLKAATDALMQIAPQMERDGLEAAAIDSITRQFSYIFFL
jgi:hypothetical protein